MLQSLAVDVGGVAGLKTVLRGGDMILGMAPDYPSAPGRARNLVLSTM